MKLHSQVRPPNQALQQTGHAKSGFARFDVFSRVSRPLSLVVLASGKAWERGKRCNDYTLETFQRNPVGDQSHLVELGQQPEVSLASVRATWPTKRRQRV
jgi:hypothetical protein